MNKYEEINKMLDEVIKKIQNLNDKEFLYSSSKGFVYDENYYCDTYIEIRQHSHKMIEEEKVYYENLEKKKAGSIK